MLQCQDTQEHRMSSSASPAAKDISVSQNVLSGGGGSISTQSLQESVPSTSTTGLPGEQLPTNQSTNQATTSRRGSVFKTNSKPTKLSVQSTDDISSVTSVLKQEIDKLSEQGQSSSSVQKSRIIKDAPHVESGHTRAMAKRTGGKPSVEKSIVKPALENSKVNTESQSSTNQDFPTSIASSSHLSSGDKPKTLVAASSVEKEGNLPPKKRRYARKEAESETPELRQNLLEAQTTTAKSKRSMISSPQKRRRTPSPSGIEVHRQISEAAPDTSLTANRQKIQHQISKSASQNKQQGTSDSQRAEASTSTSSHTEGGADSANLDRSTIIDAYASKKDAATVTKKRKRAAISADAEQKQTISSQKVSKMSDRRKERHKGSVATSKYKQKLTATSVVQPTTLYGTGNKERQQPLPHKRDNKKRGVTQQAKRRQVSLKQTDELTMSSAVSARPGKNTETNPSTEHQSSSRTSIAESVKVTKRKPTAGIEKTPVKRKSGRSSPSDPTAKKATNQLSPSSTPVTYHMTTRAAARKRKEEENQATCHSEQPYDSPEQSQLLETDRRMVTSQSAGSKTDEPVKQRTTRKSKELALTKIRISR